MESQGADEVGVRPCEGLVGFELGHRYNVPCDSQQVVHGATFLERRVCLSPDEAVEICASYDRFLAAAEQRFIPSPKTARRFGHTACVSESSFNKGR